MDQNKLLINLVDTLVKFNTQKEMLDFLVGILTSKELIEISKRLEVVKQIKKGDSHHSIAKKLSVGVATVTRGSKEIQNGRFQNI